MTTYSRSAAPLGVWIGMPLAEAQSLWGRAGDVSPLTPMSACFLPSAPAADREALRRLGWSCDRFSPVIGLEEQDAPESLLLDVTGCARLFGGEQNLAEQLQAQFEQFGLRVRIAIADTLGAAWALAHCATRRRTLMILSGDRLRESLLSLPVTALRLDPQTLSRLHEFQLRRISQLLALPRSSLPSRFGKVLLRRIDQAFGNLPESILPDRPPQLIAAAWESEQPLREAASFEQVTAQLMQTVLQRLQERGEGLQRMACRLTTPEKHTHVLSVDCVRPTTDIPHLLELLQLRAERETFPEGICRIELTVQQAGRLAVSERSLWEHEARTLHDHQVERLIERLSSRLGAEAVLRPGLVADVQPERSFHYAPAVSGGTGFQPVSGGTGFQPVRPIRVDIPPGWEAPAPCASQSRLIRPVWLLAKPIFVEALSAGADGPPYWFRWRGNDYAITHHWGPERITTGWWREEYIRRDYYHVEVACGQRFWLFRELVSGRWFLHAACD